MPKTPHSSESSDGLGGEPLIKPAAKLPPPHTESLAGTPEEIRKAWIDYMVNGFRNNEEMFRRTLEAFMKPYHLTIRMYGALFALGVALFVAAAVIGWRDSRSVVAVAFAGLGVGTFLAFFIRQPVQALEENLEFISWLGVAFNTYWTRLMYMLDSQTVQQDLKAADEDFSNTITRIIDRHAELRGKRPGGGGPSSSGSGTT